MSTKINLNGINELDLTLLGPITASVAAGIVTVTESLSGAANEVLATPNGSSGPVSLRALVPADLPVATTSAFGAVKPDGSSITISGGVISAAASGYSLGGTLSNSNFAFGPGAGTGAVLVSCGGLDGNHIIEFTTGTSPAALATIWTVTFTASRGHTTYPIVGPSSQYTSFDQAVIGGAGTTFYTGVSGFTPLAASTNYFWYVSCP